MKGKVSDHGPTTYVCLLFAAGALFLQAAASFAQNAASFSSATSISPGNSPFSIVAADFNHDGKLDIAVASGDDASALPLIPGRVSILFGQGDGSFAAGTNYAVGTVPAAVAVGDFNGDNNLDLAVANLGSNNVSILLGDGTGAFGAVTNIPAGTAPRFVAVGDLNGDGKFDLVVANLGDNSVSPALPGSISVLLGNGDGTFFASASNPSVADGDIPASIALGDLNGDGKLDLAVTNSGANSVSVHLGNGDGSFAAATTSAVGTSPIVVAVEDLNDDGKLDLVVVNSSSNNVSVLLGDGTGSFGVAKNYAVGVAPVSLALGDFNGDGERDLAVANSGSGRVSILRGKGDGTFNKAVNCCTGGSGPWSIVAGDFTADGKLDLVVTNLSGSNVSFAKGDGTGAFTPETFSVGTFPLSMATGDFDGDGKLDLASEEVLFLGNGEGTFPAATNYTAGTSPFSVAAEDFNGDGKLDLAVANAGGNDVSILLGAGTGSFGPATHFAVGTGPVFVAAADLNGDLKPDLVIVNLVSNDASILLGTGTGSFGPPTNFAVGLHPVSVSIAYFNGDTIPDLAVANAGDDSGDSLIPGTLSVLLGNGDGTFGPATDISVGNQPVSVAAADFNGDGKTDLALVNSDAKSGSAVLPGNLVILLGQGDGTFGTPTNITVGSNPAAVSIADFNYDGKPDLAIADSGSNTVSVLVGKGDGTFIGSGSLAVGKSPAFIAVGDFNDDGRFDLAVANAEDRNISILLNTTTNSSVSRTLTVTSSNPSSGVSISVTPTDKNNAGNGATQLTRAYNQGTTVTLTAAATASGNNFVRWDGCSSSAGTTCNAIMMADKTVTAVYAAPLPLAGSTLPDMEIGANYDTALVTGGVAPFTFQTTKGVLPAGLSGDPSNGHLTGSPTSPLSKKVSFSVLVTDANGLSATGAFKASGYAQLKITTKSLKAGTHGKSYKGKLAVSGGKKPFTWTETSGNLNTAGLTLDPATGAIAGTPPAAGSFNLHFRVTDALEGIAEKDLSLTIK